MVGRYGQEGWLEVGGLERVLGQAEGPLRGLDVPPIVYLGGTEVQWEEMKNMVPFSKPFQGRLFFLAYSCSVLI